MKYLVSRDVGHLQFTKIKNPKSPIQVPCMTKKNYVTTDLCKL